MRHRVGLSVLIAVVVGLVLTTMRPLQAAVGNMATPWQATQRLASTLGLKTIRPIERLAALLRPQQPEQQGGGQAGPTVTTDKSDYSPGETVIVRGTGWLRNSLVSLTFTELVNPPNHEPRTLVTMSDGNGNLDTSATPATLFDDYQLEAHDNGVTYQLTAQGPTAPDGVPGEATTTFTDLSIGTYDQCSNDQGTGYTGGDAGCRWINGNLQSQNSIYMEGDATVQRVWLQDFVPGSTHTITLTYGTTKGGKHAYDFLTTWNWSENWVEVADRCQDVTGCVTAAETALDIPQDPNVPNSFEPTASGARQFVMRGGTLTSATTPVIVSGSYAGDSETAITVQFTVSNDINGPMCETKQGVTTCGVALWFGAHVAAQANWGLGLGAGSIDGSPYHVALDAVDSASVGQRDNQMQAGVVTFVPNGTIVVIKDAVPDSPQDFSFNVNNNSTISQNFSLDDDADATLPNSQTFSVPPGTWYASELTLPAGWDFFSLLCTGGTGLITYDAQTATIELKSTETVTCTFVNNENLLDTKGRIYVDKVTVPGGDSTLFTFTPSYNSGTTFDLADATTPNNSGNLNPGTYTVSEAVTTGWSLTGLSCEVTSHHGSGSATSTFVTSNPPQASITLGAGDDVKCTFTNTRDTGSFKITKTTSNPDGATLPAAFTGTYNCGDGYTGTFSVANGASQTVTGIPTGNTCSVVETAPASITGYTWGAATYTPASIEISTKGGTFEIVVGNSITHDLGSLVLAKSLTGGPSGYTGPFTINYNCGTGFTGNVSVTAGSSQTVSGIPTGTSCTVSETVPSAPTGYSFGTPTFSPAATVSIPSGSGSSVTVTTNNTLTRDTGSLKISKTLSNPDGASVPASFTVNYDCGTGFTGSVSVSAGQAGSATVNGIPTGNTCTVTEVAPAAIADYTWGTITYTPASVVVTTKAQTYEISVGNSITRDRGSLQILKTLSNPDGASVPASFTVNYNCGTGYTGQVSVAPGSPATVNGIPTNNVCTVTEVTPTAIPNYTWGTPTYTPASVTISTKSQTFSITVGNSITRDRGKIVIIKNATPQQGSFSFTATGTGYNSFTLLGATAGGANKNEQTLVTGNYTVTESTQLGWILTGIGGGLPVNPNDLYNTKYYCTVSTTGSNTSTGVGDLLTQAVEITLGKNDTVTCVFENTGQGATRTQGFWATHSPLAQIAWFGGTFGTKVVHTFPGVAATPGIGDVKLCTRALEGPLSKDVSKLMGGFWSDVAKKTDGKKRTSLDQARMQLLQQLLAAELNASAFGSVPAGGTARFAQWEAAYCGTNEATISTAMQQAAAFNTAGDSTLFTPGTSADSKNARAIANRTFWDTLP